MKKVAEVYFIYNNFDKIKNFLVSRTKNDVKKQVFTDISNSTVKKPVSPPDVKTNPKPQPIDIMMSHLIAQATGRKS
jgi:hypothetical protein